MNIQLSDAVWLDETGVCRIEQLAEISGLSIAEIEDLIGNGLIVPAEQPDEPRVFQLRYVVTVQRARRLRDDFQLDRHGLALALTLLERVAELEAEVEALRAKLGAAD